jgi:hypothetical protein
MKPSLLFSGVLALSFFSASVLYAQFGTASPAPPNSERQEFALTLGALSGGNPSVSSGNALALGSGVAFQANFARKLHEVSWGNTFWEVNALYGPLRHLSGTPVTATSAIHSLYVTPGVKLQFSPDEKVSPWISAGAGYAFYDSSAKSISGGVTGGGPTAAAATANTYAIDFGAGVDFATGKRYVWRADVRGFYTGSPKLGTATSGGQFNFVISGGIVWRSPR